MKYETFEKILCALQNHMDSEIEFSAVYPNIKRDDLVVHDIIDIVIEDFNFSREDANELFWEFIYNDRANIEIDDMAIPVTPMNLFLVLSNRMDEIEDAQADCND